VASRSAAQVARPADKRGAPQTTMHDEPDSRAPPPKATTPQVCVPSQPCRRRQEEGRAPARDALLLRHPSFDSFRDQRDACRPTCRPKLVLGADWRRLPAIGRGVAHGIRSMTHATRLGARRRGHPRRCRRQVEPGRCRLRSAIASTRLEQPTIASLEPAGAARGAPIAHDAWQRDAYTRRAWHGSL
jgi:hypothetical protein